MMNTKHYHCPVNGWDCPYFINEANLNGKIENCLCAMGLPHPEHFNFNPDLKEMNPFYECDDFASMWDEDDDYADDGLEVD